MSSPVGFTIKSLSSMVETIKSKVESEQKENYNPFTTTDVDSVIDRDWYLRLADVDGKVQTRLSAHQAELGRHLTSLGALATKCQQLGVIEEKDDGDVSAEPEEPAAEEGAEAEPPKEAPADEEKADGADKATDLAGGKESAAIDEKLNDYSAELQETIQAYVKSTAELHRDLAALYDTNVTATNAGKNGSAAKIDNGDKKESTVKKNNGDKKDNGKTAETKSTTGDAKKKPETTAAAPDPRRKSHAPTTGKAGSVKRPAANVKK